MKAVLAGAVLAIAFLFATPVSFAQSGPVTLKGQLVCSECWFEQKDRKTALYGTEADMKCAARCSNGGIPQALAVWTGDTATLYLLEDGSFKKEGKDFLAFVAKEVEITGTTRSDGGKKFLKVDDLKVISNGPLAASAPPARTGPPPIGSQAPPLALRDLSGQEQSLASFRGKIVVLNFWATWCVPCRKEMPAFVKVQNEYAAWGVQVVAASADTAETMGQVVKFVRDQKLPFSVLTGATTDHMLAFGLGAELPGTVILDRDGKIVARFKGMVKESDLKKEIDGLLARQQPAAGGVALAKAPKSSVPA